MILTMVVLPMMATSLTSAACGAAVRAELRHHPSLLWRALQLMLPPPPPPPLSLAKGWALRQEKWLP